MFLNLLLVILPTACLIEAGPVVTTPYGELEGFEHVASDGSLAHLFLGIRYANAPDHIYRFEKPHIVDKWAPLRHTAKRFRAACIPFHKDNLQEEKKYSEDCLFLNIFTPAKKTDNTPRPVLVFIHGGGYQLGDTEKYGYKRAVDNFISQGIIVVTLQYRLGPLGFFSTGDTTVPGNMGLWDMSVALHFLHEILPAFNGDTERITVSGQSAGAAATSALVFSPHSDVLFNQAIEMSASMYAEFAMSDSVVEESLKLAKVVGCSFENSIDVVNCMKDKPMEEILEGVSLINGTRNHPNFLKFHPRLDGDFLPYSIEQMTKTAKKKATMVGVTNQESGLFVLCQDMPYFFGNAVPKAKWETFSKNDVIEFIKSAVATEGEYGSKASILTSLLIEFYLVRDAPENPNYVFYLERFTELLSDLQFVIPVMQEIELKRIKDWPTYFYVINYVSENDHLPDSPLKGSWHLSEMKYLFDRGVSEESFTAKDRQFRKLFVESIINFVSNGNPSTENFKWKPVSNNEPWQHASFTTNVSMVQRFRPEAIEFWLRTVPSHIGTQVLHKTRLPAAHAHNIHTEL